MRCSRCELEAEPGKRKCSTHLAQAVKEQGWRSRKWIESGLCDRCGKNAPDDGHKRCKKCRRQQNKAAKEYQKELFRRGICLKCCEKSADASKRYCAGCLKKRNEHSRTYYDRVKCEVFEAYGGARCNCCGETTVQFLSMDHEQNNGAEHRRSTGFGKAWASIFLWLKRNGFPPGFQAGAL